MLIGSHISTAGGVDKAFSLGTSLGLEAMQIFTRNQNQWKSKAIPPATVEAYFKERDRTGINPVFSHGSYLINLATPDPLIQGKSLDALVDELERCDLLEIPYLVLHPGSHLKEGEEVGLKRVSDNLNQAFARTKNLKAMLLLENTAGQGTNLGYRFEHLAIIRDQTEHKQNVGYCFDTCHAFAAGYDLSTEESTAAVIAELDRILGIENLKVFHFNDSKKAMGSRVDRHEHLGKGHMGLAAFRFLMRSPLFTTHPMALETPKSPDYHEDVENIAVLRELL
jgi:deoxyribonuclease-4